MFVARILDSMRIPGLKKKTVMVITSLAHHSGVIKVCVVLCSLGATLSNSNRVVKALAMEDTLLRTHASPFARARNKFFVRDTKNGSDFVQKHFVSATNVSQFAQHGNTQETS